jgi:hypothetical protein
LEDYFDGFHLDSPKPHARFRDVFRAPALCNPVFGLMRTSILRKTALIGNYAASDRVLLAELAIHGQFYEVPERLFLRRVHLQRSLAANVTDSDIAAWFDPAMRSRILLPRWRRLLEYLRAIKRAPLSCSERVHCYGQVGHFALSPKRLRGLAEDLLKATKLVLRLLLRRASESVNVGDNLLRRIV